MEKASLGNGPGFLEVGTNDRYEVVINLPRDMTGHIVFSVEQAEGLAATLTRKVREAQKARREAERIANVPPVDRSRQCTTDGRSPADARASQINETGQHASYVVLCEDEREKGFVRPYRDSYQHVGLRPVYPTRELTAEEHERYDRFGYVAYEPYPDDSPEKIKSPYVTGRFWTNANLKSGCGSVTTMSRALSETYARDPSFYGSTFCCRCNAHYPVEQFVWTADGERVGS